MVSLRGAANPPPLYPQLSQVHTSIRVTEPGSPKNGYLITEGLQTYTHYLLANSE